MWSVIPRHGGTNDSQEASNDGIDNDAGDEYDDEADENVSDNLLAHIQSNNMFFGTILDVIENANDDHDNSNDSDENTNPGGVGNHDQTKKIKIDLRTS